MYNELLAAAARLDMPRRLDGGSIDAHATAAMHGLWFAATILWPIVPNTPPPGYRHDSERLLQLRRELARGSTGTRRVRPAAPRPPARHRDDSGG